MNIFNIFKKKAVDSTVKEDKFNYVYKCSNCGEIFVQTAIFQEIATRHQCKNLEYPSCGVAYVIRQDKI